MSAFAIPEIETERLMSRQATSERLDERVEVIFLDPEVLLYMSKRDLMPLDKVKHNEASCKGAKADWIVQGTVGPD